MPLAPLPKMPPWERAVVVITILCSLLAAVGAWRLYGFGTFIKLFIKQDIPASFLILVIVLVAAFCVDTSGKMASFFSQVACHSKWLAFATFLICAIGTRFVYHHHPLSMDEYSAVAQSQIFATGHITGKIPSELGNAFLPRIYHDWFFYISDTTGEIMSVYWPGVSLVMAPFSFFGAPWLCNPTLTALTILLLSMLLEELVTDPAARGFGLLATFASPVILINGMSFFGMPLQLLCALIFTLGMIKGTTRWLLIAGAAAALGLTAVNPVPMGLYVFPWLVCAIVRKSWRKIGLLAALGLPVALILGLGWKVYAISHFPPVHQASASGGLGLAAMLNIFKAPTIAMLQIRIISLLKVYFWALPGLPVLACLALYRDDKQSWLWMMVASTAIIQIGYLFVPFDQGNGWGYRYFHVSWFVLPVMAAIAVKKIANAENMRAHIYGFTFALAIGSLALLVPFYAYKVESHLDSHLAQMPARAIGNALQVVFVRLECGSSSIDLIQNDPYLRNNEIHLMSSGHEQDEKTAALLGDRPRLFSSALCADRWIFAGGDLPGK